MNQAGFYIKAFQGGSGTNTILKSGITLNPTNFGKMSRLCVDRYGASLEEPTPAH